MNRPVLWLLATVLIVSGCATPKPSATAGAPVRTAELFPSEALITQRGVLTVRGRQVPLIGYVARSETNGLRLIMMEGFGAVLADVLVKPNGTVFVMKVTPPFRAAWVEKFVAADLRCVFDSASVSECPLRMASSNHFVIERRRYTLDVQTVEVKPGVQPAAMFDETSKK